MTYTVPNPKNAMKKQPSPIITVPKGWRENHEDGKEQNPQQTHPEEARKVGRRAADFDHLTIGDLALGNGDGPPLNLNSLATASDSPNRLENGIHPTAPCQNEVQDGQTTDPATVAGEPECHPIATAATASAIEKITIATTTRISKVLSRPSWAFNSDPMLHNTHGYYGKRTAFNLALPNKGQRIPVDLPRPGIVRVDCGAQRLDGGWIQVVDNPYYAITGADGRFTITDVRPATEGL